jgi:hypothetical protein
LDANPPGNLNPGVVPLEAAPGQNQAVSLPEAHPGVIKITVAGVLGGFSEQDPWRDYYNGGQFVNVI